MPLPETKREIYGRNPLAEVAAQLRFSPILRIEAEPPAEFQEAIRERYPLYRRAAAPGLPAEIPVPLRNLIEGMGSGAIPVQHIFETRDQRSSVTLTRDTLMLKTTAYIRWEAFKEDLNRMRPAFERIYRPEPYARIALRYVDVVRRSILGLRDRAWAELLNPFIGGELSAPEFGESVDATSRQTHCKLDGENVFLVLRTGIALAEPAHAGEIKEKCFLIDSEFHTHGLTEIDHVQRTLDIFNRASGNLFRWAIQPRLREALQPQPLGP